MVDNVGYVKEYHAHALDPTRNNSEPLPSSVFGQTYAVKAFIYLW